MTEICKDIGQIWSRLFDHRPFLSGEIKYMLKEFEEKRSDREVVNIFSILEKATEIKDTLYIKIEATAQKELPVFRAKLDNALQLMSEIDKEIETYHKENEEKLTKNRRKRQEEWDIFIDDMKFKYTRIDNAFEDKEEELRDLYTDLNHKLQINK